MTLLVYINTILPTNDEFIAKPFSALYSEPESAKQPALTTMEMVALFK